MTLLRSRDVTESRSESVEVSFVLSVSMLTVRGDRGTLSQSRREGRLRSQRTVRIRLLILRLRLSFVSESSRNRWNRRSGRLLLSSILVRRQSGSSDVRVGRLYVMEIARFIVTRNIRLLVPSSFLAVPSSRRLRFERILFVSLSLGSRSRLRLRTNSIDHTLRESSSIKRRHHSRGRRVVLCDGPFRRSGRRRSR